MKIHAGLATGWYRLHSRDGSGYTNPDTMIRGFCQSMMSVKIVG